MVPKHVSNRNEQKTMTRTEMVDDEILQRLTRIEAGQQFLCKSMKDIQKALCMASIQEEKTQQLRVEVDAMWKKVDRIGDQQKTCPIISVQGQVNKLWIFLSGLAGGLALLFLNTIIKVF